ncbi:hypothetical protein ABL78_5908 [Leptomonas seymouri]|uniref:Flagellar attachment zone protein 1 conserved domain-containing protein n=1 Tax=Leptomonas seymouri TaxID=5684 RepID=A0A0N1IIS7_LEPSE|nr:hypothetical protein ABL78_5908 [Leptomonas seymouri]|eukprot:KPI85024.1 hypothetical protein ABL78_5908 [Leptomonas seymouri]
MDDAVVSTSHVKVFDGAGWEVVVSGRELELKRVFVSDAAVACRVLQRNIFDVVFECGSLSVSFSVLHAASVTAEEVDARLSEFPFHNVLDLYRRRLEEKSLEDELRDAAEAQGRQLKEVSSLLEAKEAAAASLLSSARDALTILCSDARDDESVEDTLIREVAEVARREKELRRALDASLERERASVVLLKDAEDAALAQQREVETMRRRLAVLNDTAGILQVEALEAEERQSLLLKQISASPVSSIASGCLSSVLQLCSLLQCTSAELGPVLDERLKSLRRLESYAEYRSGEVIWYKDSIAVAAARRLRSALTDYEFDTSSSTMVQSGEEQHANLIHILDGAYKELQRVRAMCLHKEGLLDSLMKLVDRCGFSLQETWQQLGRITALASPPPIEVSTLLETKQMEQLLAVCHGLHAAAADCVDQHKKLLQLFQSTFSILSATSREAGAMNADCFSGSTSYQTATTDADAGVVSITLLSQAPKLALHLGKEIAELRRVAAAVPELASAAQQRDALVRVVAACCATLRRVEAGSEAVVLDVSRGGAAGAKVDESFIDGLAEQALQTVEAASATLSEVSRSVSSTFRAYLLSITQAISVLEEVVVSEQTHVPVGSRPMRLLDLADAVSFRVKHLEREQRSVEERRERDHVEHTVSQEASEKALMALSERLDASERGGKHLAEELVTLKRNAVRLLQRWDAVALVLGEFIERVHGTAAEDTKGQLTLTEELVSVMKQCGSLCESDAGALDCLKARLAEVCDAFQRRSSDLRRAEFTIESLKLQATDLSATNTVLGDHVNLLTSKLDASQALIASMEADAAAQIRSAAEERSSIAAAHREGLAVVEAERVALETKVSASELEVARLVTELSIANRSISSEQTRASQLKRAMHEQEADILACVAAVGNVSSLAEVGEMVATYRREYKKRCLECKEVRQRHAVALEWATTACFVSSEMRGLWTVVGALSKHFPGVPLCQVEREIQRLQGDFAEAERILGAPLSHASADGAATRAVLLRVISQVYDVFFPSVSDLSSQEGLKDSAVQQAALSASLSRKRAPTANSWLVCPDKLLDALMRQLEQKWALQEAEEESRRKEQMWCSTVVCICDSLQRALSCAYSVVTDHQHHNADDGDYGERTSLSSVTPQNTLQSALSALQLVAKRVGEHVMERAQLLRQLCSPLQSCLSTTEPSLEELVASVVREVDALRNASRESSQAQRRSANAVAMLTSLLHDATAALPDNVPFLEKSMLELQQQQEATRQVEEASGAELLRKCVAYAKECARLTSLEGELWRLLSGRRSDGGDTALRASSSLVSAVERVTVDLASLRENVVPALQAMLRTSAVDAVLYQEAADRSKVYLAELTHRVMVCYSPSFHEVKDLCQQTSARSDRLEQLLSQKTEQLKRLQNEYETLELAALQLAPGQEKCRQVMGMGASGASDTSLAAPTGALGVVEQEASVLLQVLTAYGTLATQSAQQLTAHESLKAVHEEAIARKLDELPAARKQLAEWEERFVGFASFVKEICRTLKLPQADLASEGELTELVDAVRASLPQITGAVAQLVRQSAEQQNAVRLFEESDAPAAKLMEEMQQGSATVELRLKKLQRLAETREHEEGNERTTMKTDLRFAEEAHRRLAAALLSLEMPQLAGVSLPTVSAVDSATASPARVDRAAWEAVAEAVEWLVEDAAHRVSSKAKAAVDQNTMHSRSTELSGELREKMQEVKLLDVLNRTLASIGVAPARSLEAAVILAEAHMGTHASQTRRLANLLKEREQMQRERSTLVQAVQSAEALHQAAAAGEKKLKQCITELRQRCRNAYAAAQARAETVLPVGQLPSVVQESTVELDVEGMLELVRQLVLRVQEDSEEMARLAGAREKRDETRRDSGVAEKSLAALVAVLYEELLPQLVSDHLHFGEQRLRYHIDPAALSSSSSLPPHERSSGQVSEAMVDDAVLATHEASRRLQGLREDMQGLATFLQDHFGECSTSSDQSDLRSIMKDNVTGAEVAQVSVPHSSLADTVHVASSLIHGVVEAKCTSVVSFLQTIETDLLGRPFAFAKLSFATLRPAPFVEWLQQIMQSLRAMQACSERHHRQIRRLPVFMDALVEVVRSHGGRVDLTAFRYPEAHAISSDGMPFTSHPISADDDFAELREEWQEREQEAVLDGVQALLEAHNTEIQRLTADLHAATSQYRQLSLEQTEAEHIMLELRQRVHHKVLEDEKLEANLRELDRHLDMQARELSLKYQAEQEAIGMRFSALRATIYTAVHPSLASAPATSPDLNLSPTHCTPRSLPRGCSAYGTE